MEWIKKYFHVILSNFLFFFCNLQTFHCAFCEEGFTYINELKEHLKSHERPTNSSAMVSVIKLFSETVKNVCIFNYRKKILKIII